MLGKNQLQVRPAEKSINTLVFKVISIAHQIFLPIQSVYPEQYYENILFKNLQIAGIPTLKQYSFHPKLNNQIFESSFRCDLIIAQNLLVEIKASNICEPAFFAQLNIYQKLLGLKHGLLINFAAPSFHQAIHRFYITS